MNDFSEVKFPKHFEKYDGDYIIFSYDDRKNFKVVENFSHGFSLLIDEGDIKYMLIDPNTREILFYENEDDLEFDFFKNGTFSIRNLEKYETVIVHVERIIKSLFQTIFYSMSFKEKMKYMKSSPNRNITNLNGIHQFNDIKIKLTSKDDKINEILNCSCTGIISGYGPLHFGSNNESYSHIGYIFYFDKGYIEILYENYHHSIDLGSLFIPYLSKIVVDNNSFNGFFKEKESFLCFRNEFILYEILKNATNDEPCLEFIIGLDIPEVIDEQY